MQVNVLETNNLTLYEKIYSTCIRSLTKAWVVEAGTAKECSLTNPVATNGRQGWTGYPIVLFTSDFSVIPQAGGLFLASTDRIRIHLQRQQYLDPIFKKVEGMVAAKPLVQQAVNAVSTEEGGGRSDRVMAPAGTFPLQRGMAIVSRISNPNTSIPGPGSDRKGHVLGVFDIRNPGDPSNSAPNSPTVNWDAASNSVYRHPQWINQIMGEVFGVEVDNSVPANPQIFVGSSGTFVGSINAGIQYQGSILPAEGSIGGDVFRIDGTTGNVTKLTGAIPSVAYAHEGGRGADDMRIPLNLTAGRVKSVNIISGGSGYVAGNTVTFTSSQGSGATGYITL
mgnify:CR=1 FL=1